ncbi:MAG: hypothetical protein QM791_05625 [Ferruginibacter sp.]
MKTQSTFVPVKGESISNKKPTSIIPVFNPYPPRLQQFIEKIVYKEKS